MRVMRCIWTQHFYPKELPESATSRKSCRRKGRLISMTSAWGFQSCFGKTWSVSLVCLSSILELAFAKHLQIQARMSCTKQMKRHTGAGYREMGMVKPPGWLTWYKFAKLPPLKSSVARLFLLWIIKCCILNYFVVQITVHVILLCFGALCVQNEVPGCAEGPGACDAFIITLKHFGWNMYI